jgi:chitinase
MGNVYQLIQLKKKYPHLKVYASIGGWTYSKEFHQYMLTDAKRKTLVTSCVNLVRQYSTAFDGIDIDLEYPCLPNDTSCGDGITPSPNDKDAFTALIQEFRNQMGPNMPLTIATNASP